MYSSHLSQRSSVDRNLYLQHVSIQLHHHCQLDDDEEHGEDDDDGKEEAGSGKGGILFASQGSKAQNCIELVAPNIQRISSFRKFIFSQTVC